MGNGERLEDKVHVEGSNPTKLSKLKRNVKASLEVPELDPLEHLRQLRRVAA